MQNGTRFDSHANCFEFGDGITIWNDSLQVGKKIIFLIIFKPIPLIAHIISCIGRMLDTEID